MFFTSLYDDHYLMNCAQDNHRKVCISSCKVPVTFDMNLTKTGMFQQIKVLTIHIKLYKIRLMVLNLFRGYRQTDRRADR
jgi:hypothetical protein